MPLIIGSTAYSQWQQLRPLFIQAGLSLADATSVEDWYRLALAAGATSDPKMARQPIFPSKVLQQSATELLDAERGPVLLGPETPDNVWLLNFWAQKYEDTGFILFYSRPETALVEAMQQGIDPVEALQQWALTAQQLLSFYRHNRRRAALFDIACAYSEPTRFVDICSSHFGLTAALTATIVTEPEIQIDPPSAILKLIAAEALRQGPDLSSLLAELEASSVAAAPLPRVSRSATELFQTYHAGESALQGRLSALETSQADATQENELLLLQLHQVQEELESTFVAAQAESSKEDCEQENELLLLQLHQVQEELEHYFLQYQAQAKELEAARKLMAIKERPESELQLTKAGKVSRERIKKLFHNSWYQRQAGKRARPLAHYLRYGWKSNLSPHPLFDPLFYIQSNGLQDLKYCPLIHFINVGSKLGYAPHPLFDCAWYLSEYPDVKESGTNPLTHYLNSGASEGRDPSAQFHTEWYLATYPDVRESGINPLLHYAQFGEADQRKKNPYEL